MKTAALSYTKAREIGGQIPKATGSRAVTIEAGRLGWLGILSMVPRGFDSRPVPDLLHKFSKGSGTVVTEPSGMRWTEQDPQTEVADASQGNARS